MHVRAATHADLSGILTIYNDVVATSTAIYTDQPSTLEQRRAWFDDRVSRGFPVLVAAQGGTILGFTSFGEFRGAWPGYAFTVEHTVLVGEGQRGRGVGRALLEALLPIAAAMGKHVILGAIDADNDASLRFHARLGFEHVAHMKQVGRKFDRWLDLVFMQKFL
jgi:L-amino acid N-acyltransferase